MSVVEQWLADRMQRAFRLTQELFEELPAESLRLDLPGLPSNTLGSQAWCIAGARESYLRAVRAGAWAGFRCSLTDRYDRESVLTALRESAARFGEFWQENPSLSEMQVSLLADLLEHEVQHHGQLIRYVYAHRLGFPPSWNRRYTV
jgi:uncharacterized damage-inducible protein DinB